MELTQLISEDGWVLSSRINIATFFIFLIENSVGNSADAGQFSDIVINFYFPNHSCSSNVNWLGNAINKPITHCSDVVGIYF